MATTWKVLIDWDRNGNFSGLYDDVTARVIQANWFIGFRQAYMEMADNSLCAITLANPDGLYTPEKTPPGEGQETHPLAGKIVPLRPVEIQSIETTGESPNQTMTTRVHFRGWLEAIKPLPGKFGPRTITLIASGAMQFLQAAETRLELQENKRSSQIIDLLMKQVIMPPALTQATLLDIPGYSELTKPDADPQKEIKRYLPTTSGYSQFDDGAVTMTIAGDNWVNDGGYADKPKDTFDVYRAIRDLVMAERGKFFFDREGKAVFWNRQHLLRKPASTYTVPNFSDTMKDLQYTYAGPDMLKNDITVVCHPRSIGSTDDDILWTLPADSAVRVDPNTPRTIYVKYEDEQTRGRIGAKEVHITDLTTEMGSVTVSIEAQANSAEITFENNGTSAAYVTGLKVRGRKIIDSGLMEARKTDAASINVYGRRSMRLNLASLMSLDDAEDIAIFEKRRRATPRGDVQSMTMMSHAKFGGGQHQNQLTYTLGNQIKITETQTQHSAEYWIIGEAHEINGAGTLYQTTWYLERAPTETYFVLGEDETDSMPLGPYGASDDKYYLAY